MKINSKATFLCLIMASCLYAQMLNDAEQHPIKNVSLLYPFFDKLIQLEENKDRKINIVHVGDSHIQSDFLISAIRKPLQQQFGNGGHGFVFPYSLNKQVAGKPYNFYTNAIWQICRNNLPFRCEPGTEFGLSGYGFNTRTGPFVLSVEASEEMYKFNTIKMVFPTASSYRLAAVDGDKKPIIHNERSGINVHKVKSGENLDIISKKYKVSVADIKSENNMKSNRVYVGRSLRIPIRVTETSVDTSMFRPLEYQLQEPFVLTYHQEKPISAIYLLPAKKQNRYSLNGLVVENDVPGLIYHNIGTVGSMAVDFNSKLLFFEQLPVLLPDLVIVSFGTNESYNSIPAEKFIEQMELFIKNIKIFCHNVPILVTTPPISLLKHKRFNKYILEYSNALLRKENIALWDLYSFTKKPMGAEENIAATKISKDYVHYTSEGYIDQGTAFANDILNEYKYYKRSRE